MNFIEAARKARAGSDGTPVFTEPALTQARMPPAYKPKKGSGDSPLPKTRGCFSCHHYDGKGTAWPGMCRNFETIGQAAQEIDFNVVDVARGCKLYITQSFQAKADSPCLICGKPLHQDGGDCWHKSFHLGETARPMQRNTQRNAELREQTK